MGEILQLDHSNVFVDPVPVHLHPAGRRFLEAGHDIEQGRFAATRGPDDRHELAFPDLEVDVTEGFRRFGVPFEPLAEHDELQCGPFHIPVTVGSPFARRISFRRVRSYSELASVPGWMNPRSLAQVRYATSEDPMGSYVTFRFR